MSIIIPTYNESANISKLIEAIKDNLPYGIFTEIIVVDDNSPDNTAKIAEEYFSSIKEKTTHTINVIKRKAKDGLSSAILNGIQQASGNTIIVMDSDFSHPPQIIPKLIAFAFLLWSWLTLSILISSGVTSYSFVTSPILSPVNEAIIR